MRLLFLIIFTLILSQSIAAKSSKDFDKEIANVKQSLSSSQKKQAQLTEQLKSAEKTISSLSVTINNFNKKITSQNTSLKEQEEQLSENQQILDGQRTTFSTLISANYQLQRRGRIGLYFSGKSASEIKRYLAYYQAIDKSLLTAIQKLQSSVDQRKDLILDINKDTASLRKLLDEQTAKKQQISAEQSKRQNILKQLDKTITGDKGKLGQLISDQKNLSKVVNQLATTSSNTNFSDMRGKLQWPVNGKLIHSFGQSMSSRIVKWNGDLISAPQETPVHAVYTGKVVYADWLSGYGLLLIVDHGHGYLSLYGRNHSLYKKVGDAVQTGEQIATVGQSGGYTDSGLYFEIRKNDNAVNPRPWFSTSRP
jgi:murein hydrolase activator